MGGDRRRSSFRRRDLRGHAVWLERVTASGCGGSGSTLKHNPTKRPGMQRSERLAPRTHMRCGAKWRSKPLTVYEPEAVFSFENRIT